MTSHPFFEEYDLLLLLLGLVLLLTTLGVALLKRFNLTTTMVYIALGLLAGPLFLDLAPQDPREAIPVLKRVSELAVILSLIVVGIRIGRPLTWDGWRSTTRLILIVMPATIATIALAGHWLFGLAFGPAILLGAVLAPTDPILAGPLEEHSLDDESEDRFGLSSEAGFNDGFAFPFIYLGLYATLSLAEWRSWIGYWVVMDLLYAVVLALPVGWYLGLFCGRWFLERASKGEVSEKRLDFVPLALLLAVYGLVEALGAYGFLAAFTTGLGLRRALDEEHEQLGRLANFTEAVDGLLKAVLLVMLGALLRLEDFLPLGWPLLLFPLLVILLIRPALTYAATARGNFDRSDRIYWSWFGIRGLGSIYYLSYALDNGIEEPLAGTLFAITVATILASALLHGFSLRPFIRRFEGEEDVEE
jgi:sodium/hydrogen antiporter